MPNDDACIICGSASTLQMSVLTVNGSVRFLHDNGHFIVTQKANGQRENPNTLILNSLPKVVDKERGKMLLLPTDNLS